MMRDLHNKLKALRGISPTRVADNTALVSQIVTNDAQSLEAVIAVGTLADADANFTVLVEHGQVADLSDAAAVPDDYLLGIEGVAATPTGASFRFDNDDSIRTIGYIGPYPYVRMTITPAANTGNADISMVWLQAGMRVGPDAGLQTS